MSRSGMLAAFCLYLVSETTGLSQTKQEQIAKPARNQEVRELNEKKLDALEFPAKGYTKMLLLQRPPVVKELELSRAQEAKLQKIQDEQTQEEKEQIAALNERFGPNPDVATMKNAREKKRGQEPLLTS